MQFLCELSSAWQWTVDCRKGLFSVDRRRTSPLSRFDDADDELYIPNVVPHELWIEFFVQRFEVVKYSNSDKVSSLHHMREVFFKISNNSWGGGGYTKEDYDIV